MDIITTFQETLLPSLVRDVFFNVVLLRIPRSSICECIDDDSFNKGLRSALESDIHIGNPFERCFVVVMHDLVVNYYQLAIQRLLKLLLHDYAAAVEIRSFSTLPLGISVRKFVSSDCDSAHFALETCLYIKRLVICIFTALLQHRGTMTTTQANTNWRS